MLSNFTLTASGIDPLEFNALKLFVLQYSRSISSMDSPSFLVSLLNTSSNSPANLKGVKIYACPRLQLKTSRCPYKKITTSNIAWSKQVYWRKNFYCNQNNPWKVKFKLIIIYQLWLNMAFKPYFVYHILKCVSKLIKKYTWQSITWHEIWKASTIIHTNGKQDKPLRWQHVQQAWSILGIFHDL